MTQSIYSNYDPLYANGILYAPMKELTFSEMPVAIPNPGYAQIPVSASQVDKFVAQAKNPNPTPAWKKVLFYGLLAGATIWGLKKFKINPFKKITNNPTIKNIGTKISDGYNIVKNFVVTKYDNVKNFIISKFKKP